MAASSLSVVGNASRLRRWHPHPVDTTRVSAAGDPIVETGTDDTAAIPTGQVTDPVCGMTVDPATAAATAEHDGHTYHFCSPHCRDTFTADPDPETVPSSHAPTQTPAPSGRTDFTIT